MNPIIFLLPHPRSMTTAIERVMRECGDFESYHEHHLQFYHKLLKHSLTSLAHGY
jgi:hypothetical protein